MLMIYILLHEVNANEYHCRSLTIWRKKVIIEPKPFSEWNHQTKKSMGALCCQSRQIPIRNSELPLVCSHYHYLNVCRDATNLQVICRNDKVMGRR